MVGDGVVVAIVIVGGVEGASVQGFGVEGAKAVGAGVIRDRVQVASVDWSRW